MWSDVGPTLLVYGYQVKHIICNSSCLSREPGMIAFELGWLDHGRFCQRDLPLEQDNWQKRHIFCTFHSVELFWALFSLHIFKQYQPPSVKATVATSGSGWMGRFFNFPSCEKRKEKKDVNCECLLLCALFSISIHYNHKLVLPCLPFAIVLVLLLPQPI